MTRFLLVDDANPDRSAPAAWVAVVVWSLFFAAYLLATEGADMVESVAFQAQRRDVDGSAKRALVAAAVWLGAAAAFVPVCLHRVGWVRWTARVLVVAAAALAFGWRAVTGAGFGIHEANLILREIDFAPDAMRFYAVRWAWAGVLAVGAAALLFRVADRKVPRFRPWWVIPAPAIAFVVCLELHDLTAAKVYEFPSAIRIPLLLQHASAQQVIHFGEREAPRLAPVGPPAAKHVILIVDESVSGDLLGINGGPAATTPTLSGLGDRLRNFGIASAIANFSSATNIAIQSGLRPDQIPDREALSLRNPNLFAYMAKAGFRTFYVDGQTYSDPSNYMTEFDVEALDGFLQVVREDVGLEGHEVDIRIADLLVDLVAQGEASFSYVLKSGAHFEYELRYPPEGRVFEPTLARGELMSLSFEGADRERVVNSYLNALRWTVDGFLARLMAGLEATGEDVLVLYTSDHGQSLLELSPETGRRERLAHNQPKDPPVFQAMVPLLLLAVGAEPDAWLDARFDASLRDRVDQFAIFPTLLEAAGYAKDEVASLYGPGLFDAAAAREPRRFLSGDLFGRAPWAINDFEPARRGITE